MNLYNISKCLAKICKRKNFTFLISSSPVIAKAVGADGVHLGEDDSSILDARKLLGPKAIIGASCYNSKHLAMKAAEQGANYVAFGAFFETKTKKAKTKAVMSLIEDWVLISDIPCVAIGGSDSKNCHELIEAGVDFIAVIGAIWNNKDSPRKEILKFKNIIV